MQQQESWLPELVLLEGCSGDWAIYLETIYQHFRKDFMHSKPQYENKRWAVKRHPLIKEKEATFWHIISEGSVESERLPDLRRCERVRWPRPIIDGAKAGQVKLWKNKRGNEERVVLALADFSYVVILADRGDYVMLWTAYCVERDHQRRKLEKEYQAYKNG